MDNSGEFDGGTTHRRDFEAKTGERPAAFRPLDQAGSSGGNFDDGTTHKTDYGQKFGERAIQFAPVSQACFQILALKSRLKSLISIFR